MSIGTRVKVKSYMPNQSERTGTIMYISGNPFKPYMIRLDVGGVVYAKADELTVIEDGDDD
jgi:hypothetical protein